MNALLPSVQDLSFFLFLLYLKDFAELMKDAILIVTRPDLGALVTGIEKISPEVEIDVSFSPKRNQPEKVLEILGNEGEFIKGSGIDQSLGFTTFSVSKSINIPFKE